MQPGAVHRAPANRFGGCDAHFWVGSATVSVVGCGQWELLHPLRPRPRTVWTQGPCPGVVRGWRPIPCPGVPTGWAPTHWLLSRLQPPGRRSTSPSAWPGLPPASSGWQREPSWQKPGWQKQASSCPLANRPPRARATHACFMQSLTS